MLRKIIAGIVAVMMAVPAGTAALAAKGSTDVDVAAGKSAISACYGNGEYGGGTVANVTSDSGIFVSDGGWNSEHMEIITIDLGSKYRINQIDVENYYAYQSQGDYYNYGNDVVFDCYVMNTAPASQSDAPTSAVKLNVIGDKFQARTGGGYDSHFELSSPASYRYVQLRLLKGTEQNTAFRISRIKVWAPQEEALAPVSVGKPAYTGFDGTAYSSGVWNINDGNTSTVYSAYGANNDNADVIIDLENTYPIKKVTQTTASYPIGTIAGVYASNDSSFASSVALSYDSGDNSWYLDDSTPYKYIKVDYNVAPHTSGGVGSDSTNVVWDQAEITVYSTQSAAAQASAKSTVNIATGKSFTSNEPGYDVYYDDNANDGNDSTYWFTFATTPRITYDLGASYTIENVRTKKIGNLGYKPRGYAVAKVEVSNDPNFSSGKVVELSGHRYRFNNDTYDYSCYTSYSQAVLPSEVGSYRYVRITGNKETFSDWQLNEVEIYVPTSEAACENRALGRSVTLYNDDGTERGAEYNYYTMVKESFVDGNESTQGGLSNNCVLVELDYPQKIEWIDVVMRSGAGTNNKKGYNVYLSNEKSNNLSNALPIGTTDESAPYVDGETIRYNVDTNTRYKYVLISGYNNGECIAKEIKVFSSSEPEPVVEPSVSAENGNQTQDGVKYMTWDATPANVETDEITNCGFAFVNTNSIVDSEPIVWQESTKRENGTFGTAIAQMSGALSSTIYAIPYIVGESFAKLGTAVPSLFE